MTGEERIEAPRERVWAALNDPAVLKDCIPGCQSLEQTAPNKLAAVAAIKVGPIGARFRGEVTLSQLDPPNGYRLDGEGQGGVAGFAKGGADVRLEADGPDATILRYAVDVQIGGKLAQVGGALLDATAKQMAGAFFRKFGQRVTAPEVAEPAAAISAPAAAAPSTEVPSAAAPAGAAAAPAAAQAVYAAPAGGKVGWVVAVAAALILGWLAGQGGVSAGIESLVSLLIALVVVVAAMAGYLIGRTAGPLVVIHNGEKRP
jgi:carbon monoxide dehydrogenase subunit G